MSERQFFPNAIYPIWFVPDKKPVAGEKKIDILHSEVWQIDIFDVFSMNGIGNYPAAGIFFRKCYS